MARRQPTSSAIQQASSMTQPVSSWTDNAIDSIIAGRSLENIQRFKQQPSANKLIALENAVVPTRRNETPNKIVALLDELVRMGAITAAEAAPLYSDLLIRVHRYNSSNVQTNLQTLIGDIRSAQSEAIRNSDIESLSNQIILNNFFNTIPSVVPLGQQNYDALKQTLRLFVNEAPNVILFKSGPSTMLQVNIRGVNTVNLNDAFSNLQRLYGVTVQSDIIPATLTTQLSANTRVLLLLLAPFTNDYTFTPDTLLSLLFQLYRDTISASLERPEATEREIETIARDMGTSGLDLTRTMGFLLKNREDLTQPNRQLTNRQLQVLRFIQESLTDRIDRNGEDPMDALENLMYSFAPSYYEENGSFIRRIIGYMQKALENSPSYFREIYANKFWLPPPSFWSQNYTDFFNERTSSQRIQPTTSNSFTTNELPIVRDPIDDLEWDTTTYQTAITNTVPFERAQSLTSVPMPPSDSGFNTDGTRIRDRETSSLSSVSGLTRRAAIVREPTLVRRYRQERDLFGPEQYMRRIRRYAQRIREANLPASSSSVSTSTVRSGYEEGAVGPLPPNPPNPFSYLQPKTGSST